MDTTLSLLAEASPERVSQYARLFAAVASLLGIFMLGIVLLGYLHRRRVARQERDAATRRLHDDGEPDAPADPWIEAGRRDAPYSGAAGAEGEAER